MVSEWATYASLAVAASTALATVVLVAVTWVLALETKRLADAGRSPQVLATFEPSPWSLMHTDLVLENTGTATAYDITLSLDPLPLLKRGKEALPLPLQRVSLLKPGQSFTSFLAGFEKLNEQRFDVEVSWSRSPGANIREKIVYTLDLKQDYEGWRQLGGGAPAVQMARELKKLREDIGSLASGFKRLRVDTHDSRDRLREERQQRAIEREWGRREREEDKPSE